MSLFAHYAGPAGARAAASEFELVHTRYVAVPALLWSAAILVTLLVTVAQVVPARMAGHAPSAPEVCECIVQGA